MRKKQIVGKGGQLVTTMDIFFHQCPCGEFCVDGTWDQLTVVRRTESRVVVSSPPCHKCGHVFGRTFRLTTSNWPFGWSSGSNCKFMPHLNSTPFQNPPGATTPSEPFQPRS